MRPRISKMFFVVEWHKAAALNLSFAVLEYKLSSGLLGDCCYATTENTILLQIQVQLQLLILHSTMPSVLVRCLINAQKHKNQLKKKSQTAALSDSLRRLCSFTRRERNKKSLALSWCRKGNSSTVKIWQRHVCLCIHKNAQCADT